MAKMRALVIGAAALAGSASAFPTPGTTYGAAGTEPFWGLTFRNGRMIYEVVDRPSISVPQPRPTAIRSGRRYSTARMTVEITREGRCNDGMSDHYYQETVKVWLGRRAGRPLYGCGGPRVPPPELTGSRWHIVAIGGQAVSGDDYFIEFDQDRLTGQAGCNRFSGPYGETRPTLRPGAIAATRMVCPGARMEHERRALEILSAPLSMNFLDGRTLVLGNRAGQIRLRSVD
ncbi:MAG: META domain-containing protein [Alphaproteobacteria bacterium]|nr:MAG: META domain-containing protein [Alphaproteobacteria bacterium]